MRTVTILAALVASVSPPAIAKGKPQRAPQSATEIETLKVVEFPGDYSLLRNTSAARALEMLSAPGLEIHARHESEARWIAVPAWRDIVDDGGKAAPFAQTRVDLFLIGVAVRAGDSTRPIEASLPIDRKNFPDGRLSPSPNACDEANLCGDAATILNRASGYALRIRARCESPGSGAGRDSFCGDSVLKATFTPAQSPGSR